MKRWVLPMRVGDHGIFEAIRSGEKSIETRAGGRYDAIEVGDTLEFRCGPDRLAKLVKSIQRFDSAEDLFRSIPRSAVLPEASTDEAAIKTILSFTGNAERIAERGILAFEMEEKE